MRYKIYLDITRPNRRCYGEYWRSSLLIRQLLNVKNHVPYKWMHSKYQIIKILENCFQNTHCFFLDQCNSSLVHLKWYCNFPHLEPPCFSLIISVKFCSSQLKLLFSAILVMYFINFLTLSYPIRPHAITNIG